MTHVPAGDGNVPVNDLIGGYEKSWRSGHSIFLATDGHGLREIRGNLYNQLLSGEMEKVAGKWGLSLGCLFSPFLHFPLSPEALRWF
jgi:hypothetical protein